VIVSELPPRPAPERRWLPDSLQQAGQKRAFVARRQQRAKLTDPLLEARVEFSKLTEAWGKKVACRFAQSGVQRTAHSGVYDFLQSRLIADD
jgi:hypothetical protein